MSASHGRYLEIIESSNSKCAFTLTVINQLRTTKERYAQRGLAWVVPPSLVPDLKRMYTMAKRYDSARKAARGTGMPMRGQHTYEEAQSEAAVALWVLCQYNRLHGFPEPRELVGDFPWLGRAIVA